MPQPSTPRDFLVVHVLLSALRTLPRLSSKADAKQIIRVLACQVKNPKVFRQSVFAIILPRTYALWLRRVPNSVLPAVLSSPLLYLVEPPSLRRTLAVYVATAAAINFKRDSKLRQILPPTWTLFIAANSWLLWAFLFKPKWFPQGYGDIILRHSGYGSGEPTEQLIEFLQQTQFDCYPPGVLSSSTQSPRSSSIHPAHTRAVCARLHPETPSCTKAYIRAWLTQFPQVFRWVGAFGALPLLFKRQKLSKRPLSIFRDWLISSLRGTAFIVGCINTAWGLTCLFQRIFHPGTFANLRWIMNGLLGNLWVLILPTSRQTDFALYSTRLAVVNFWDQFDQWSPKYGDIFVLALSWSCLLRDQQNGRGPGGLGGVVLNYIDAHAHK